MERPARHTPHNFERKGPKMADGKKSSDVFGEITRMVDESVERFSYSKTDIDSLMESPLRELRRVEDTVITMTPGDARNQLLALLGRLRDDVVDPLIVLIDE